MNKRPVNLDLRTIHFPITAIVSISHRISGVVLFLSLPWLLWQLDYSLSSPIGFQKIQILNKTFIYQMLWWIFLSNLSLHLAAGCRHLLMDLGFAEGRQSGRLSAALVLVISSAAAVMVGLGLWA